MTKVNRQLGRTGLSIAKMMAPMVATLLPLTASSDPLVVYLHDFEDVIGERFTADTGYEVEVVKESGGDLLARIAAERNSPQWDVVVYDGIGSLERLNRQGQLHQGYEAANTGNLDEHGQDLLPEDRAFYPVARSASCIIAYRTDKVDQPPEDVDELSAPRFRGEVGQADPAVAAPAYPCVAGIHHRRGKDGARDLYSSILDNDLQVFRSNGPTRRALVAGDISVALLSSQNAYTAMESGHPVDVVWPEDGAPGSAIGVGIQAETEESEAAQAFVEWMLEPKTHTFLAEEAGSDGIIDPLLKGMTPPERGPSPDASYYIAPASWAAEHEADIKTWFADQADG